MAHRKRILLVEDDADTRDVLRAILEAAGYSIEEAPSGTDALRLAPTCEPDVVCLDLGLPDLPGEEVARKLVSVLPNRRPFLIAITGWADEAHRQSIRAAGVDAFFLKPFDPDELQRLLARELNSHSVPTPSQEPIDAHQDARPMQSRAK